MNKFNRFFRKVKRKFGKIGNVLNKVGKVGLSTGGLLSLAGHPELGALLAGGGALVLAGGEVGKVVEKL